MLLQLVTCLFLLLCLPMEQHGTAAMKVLKNKAQPTFNLFNRIPKSKVGQKRVVLEESENPVLEEKASRTKANIKSLGTIVHENIKVTFSDKHLDTVVKSMEKVIGARIPKTNHNRQPLNKSEEPVAVSRGTLKTIVAKNINGAIATGKHLESMTKSMRTLLSAKIPKVDKNISEEKADIDDGKPVAPRRTIETIVRNNLNNAVAVNHLESVANSMKTVLFSKIPKVGNKIEETADKKRLQPHLNVKSKPIVKSENPKNAGQSAPMPKSNLQGFEVENDSSNKVVFLDIESLRSSGLDMDQVSISVGGDRKPLKQAVGSRSQLFIPGLEQKKVVTEKSPLAKKALIKPGIRFSVPTPEPTVSVKHVAASQAAAVKIVRPRKKGQTARQSSFFEKFEDSGKFSEPVSKFLLDGIEVRGA